MTATVAHAPSGLRLWWLAVRPKTLSIAIVPVLVATALAWAQAGAFDPGVALVAALAAVLIQAGTNLHNDAGDYLRGGDSGSRVGPQRVTAQGWATPRQVLRAAEACFVLAAVCGLYLVWVGGWPILALGVASLAAAWGYTGGPKPIAYTPLGELFVVLFFGLGAVGGTYWLHRHAISAEALVAGLAVGLPAAAVLVVNNYRDMDGDRRAGRRTLPILLGEGRSRVLFAALVLAPFVLLWPLEAVAPGAWLALLAVPPALGLIRAFATEPRGPGFNRLLARTAKLQVLYAVLLATGLLLSAAPAAAAEPVEAVFRDAEGREVRLSDFRGRATLVEFWATWCAPCRRDLPHLDDMAERLANEGLSVVPISIDRLGLPRVRRFYEELGIATLPIYLDANREAVRALGIEYVPAALLLAPDGSVLKRWDKGPDWAEAEDEVEALLAGLGE